MNMGRWWLLFFGLYVFLKASAWYMSVRFQILEDTFSAWQFLVDMNLWLAAGVPTYFLARFMARRKAEKQLKLEQKQEKKRLAAQKKEEVAG